MIKRSITTQVKYTQKQKKCQSTNTSIP